MLHHLLMSRLEISCNDPTYKFKRLSATAVIPTAAATK
ncbi:hypothetical protein C3B55_00357 [Candidatus Pseudomonas adelgestsugas]|uniref:Uncharacterized protein n=1 Tax=Candidatus Pseudomonas adelgestsugas TaxID=1302376 RepID=A0ABX5R8T1_9PSED|nr:hypothetical protein C3B55_00357 [Candidatus Pseudomonas adelgestsugas]